MQRSLLQPIDQLNLIALDMEITPHRVIHVQTDAVNHLHKRIRVIDDFGTSYQTTAAEAIVTHGGVHQRHMRALHELAVRRGLRERLLLVAGGPMVTDALARACGMDAGFGRGATGHDVASFLVQRLRAMELG